MAGTNVRSPDYEVGSVLARLSIYVLFLKDLDHQPGYLTKQIKDYCNERFMPVIRGYFTENFAEDIQFSTPNMNEKDFFDIKPIISKPMTMFDDKLLLIGECNQRIGPIGIKESLNCSSIASLKYLCKLDTRIERDDMMSEPEDYCSSMDEKASS